MHVSPARSGIAVPDDISIVGFDNTKIARMSIPKLTTVAQPMYEMGKAGMEVLRRLREEEPLDQLRIYMKHVIVERESVKSLM